MTRHKITTISTSWDAAERACNALVEAYIIKDHPDRSTDIYHALEHALAALGLKASYLDEERERRAAAEDGALAADDATALRCEGMRRRGGAFSFGKPVWTECENPGVVMLKIHDNDTAVPCCVVCLDELVRTDKQAVESIQNI